MTFADAVENLASGTESRLVTLFGQLNAGTITLAEFQAATLAIVTAARAQGVALADLGLAAAVEAATRTPTPAIGLTVPQGDDVRLRKGLTTLLGDYDGTDSLVARVARYGRSEPAAAMQDGMIDGMRYRKIEGYTRGLNATACQLCVWLFKEGYVYPSDAPFHRHTGCTCHPVPAILRVRAYGSFD